jgi:drug/metabolite transporter (DMT)-like permease
LQTEEFMRDSNASAGIIIMALVATGGAVDAAIVRTLAGDVHPFMIGFTRVAFGLMALIPFIVRRPEMLRTKARLGHVLRAGLKLGALVALFAALQSAPLATVTAIGFAAPLFVTLGAWLFMSELPGVIRIIGLVFGFAGVIVILAPGLAPGEGGAMGFALLSAVLTAAIQLILKRMGRSEPANTLVVWNLIVSLPLAIVPALFFWSSPTPLQWGLLAAQGVIGAVSQLGVTRALQLADASLVAPIDFLRLPMVAAMGWFVFSQVPPFTTWVGAILIFIAIVLLASSSGMRSIAARP